MTVSEIMESPETNQAGWFVTAAAFIYGLWGWVTENANEVIVIVSGLLGIVFLFYKIRIAILDYKLKKKEVDDKLK